MKRRFQCPACGYTYDEKIGDSDEGFPAGTSWDAIPDDWFCPDCAVRDKVDFSQVGESAEESADAPKRGREISNRTARVTSEGKTG